MLLVSIQQPSKEGARRDEKTKLEASIESEEFLYPMQNVAIFKSFLVKQQKDALFRSNLV
jgi:hypothetical protein